MSLDNAARRDFERVLGAADVISDPPRLRSYECDGLTGYRVVPALVLLPRTAEQVAASVRVCAEHGIPFVARGAGTGLSGGALPVADGVVISLQRLRRVLEVDPVDRRAVLEPGVTNLDITRAAAPYGLYYAPDPSSQQVCTIGGNVAENAGGAHCLKYGFTTTHVLALDVVLPSGELVQLGAPTLDAPGYDLAGVFVGSEGTLGVATKITLRIVKRPEVVQTLLAAFDSIQAAGQTVSDVIAARMLPSAMEIMDDLSIQAAEAAVHAHYPVCKGLLLVELDGPCSEVEELMRAVKELCRNNGASEIRIAQSEQERALVWKGRKAAFAAMGRISPNYIVQDGVIPRTALPRLLDEIEQLATAAGLRVANVFHAGDGNLHPLVLYDQAVAGQEEKALQLSYRILRLCVDHGGSITGEHGVGKEKQEALGYMFAEPDLATMQLVRCAFDPENIANPDKVFPRPRLCAEKPGPYTPHPLERAGIAEIF
jgi:glycolate oxidase